VLLAGTAALLLSQSTSVAMPPPPASRDAVPTRAKVALPAPALPAYARSRPSTFAIARIRAGRSIALRVRAASSAVTRVESRTQFGSPQTLAVARTKGRWLGVVSTALPNGRLGWIDRRSGAVSIARTPVSLRADLSRRTLELRRSGRVIKRLKVAVGRAGSSTPTGRFAITDKLSGPAYGSYFGCCILALSGHQPNLPAGWQGADRLAIHGTDSPATIGRAASAGCLRAADDQLRVLMREVPLGTPVFVRQ